MPFRPPSPILEKGTPEGILRASDGTSEGWRDRPESNRVHLGHIQACRRHNPIPGPPSFAPPPGRRCGEHPSPASGERRMVRAAGIAPASRGYQPRILLLNYARGLPSFAPLRGWGYGGHHSPTHSGERRMVRLRRFALRPRPWQGRMLLLHHNRAWPGERDSYPHLGLQRPAAYS